ncbi:MORN motif precursor, partial [Gammaproteobacteria bacterium]|nr:MORN motif precursor [Gammaproteobacteria bacterium]
EHSEYWLSQNTENYTGNFVNDHYQGEGTYRWPNGQRYEGKFFASKKHGPGTFFYATGTRRNQVWEYGRFIM